MKTYIETNKTKTFAPTIYLEGLVIKVGTSINDIGGIRMQLSYAAKGSLPGELVVKHHVSENLLGYGTNPYRGIFKEFAIAFAERDNLSRSVINKMTPAQFHQEFNIKISDDVRSTIFKFIHHPTVYALAIFLGVHNVCTIDTIPNTDNLIMSINGDYLEIPTDGQDLKTFQLAKFIALSMSWYCYDSSDEKILKRFRINVSDSANTVIKCNADSADTEALCNPTVHPLLKHRVCKEDFENLDKLRKMYNDIQARNLTQDSTAEPKRNCVEEALRKMALGGNNGYQETEGEAWGKPVDIIFNSVVHGGMMLIRCHHTSIMIHRTAKEKYTISLNYEVVAELSGRAAYSGTIIAIIKNIFGVDK